MLKDLLEKDFVSHHGIHVSPVVDAVMVSSASCLCRYPCGCFDLDDMPSPVQVLPHTDSMYLMLHPYTNPYERYLSVEAEATAENGAIVPCPMIEQKGFEYRRIDHRKVFSLN